MDSEMEQYRREQSAAYLKRVRDAKRHINALSAEVDEHRALASGLSGIDYTRDKVTTSSYGDAVPDAVIRLLDVIEERLNLVVEYTSMMAECGESLARMGGVLADVLRYRYVCDYQWEHIAAKMHYSEQWLYELHNKALVSFWEYMPAHERDPLPPAI